MAQSTAYALRVSHSCDKDFRALLRKNRPLADALSKKVGEILAEPHGCKPLRFPLAGKFRVHVLKSFVLIFQIDEKSRCVEFLRFAHHDEAYR